MSRTKLSKLLTTPFAIEILFRIVEESPKISDLERNEYNPDGIASSRVVGKIRTLLTREGLIREELEKPKGRGGRIKRLRATEKGMRVYRALLDVNIESSKD